MWDTASDIWITSATKMRLLADSQTPALDINVDTWAGVVTLFGIVPSQEAKAAAEADARKVSGVKRVVERTAGRGRAPSRQRDRCGTRKLERDVKKAFDTADLKDISVEVKNGVVRLTGTIPSGARRLEAAVAARCGPGRARGRGRSALGQLKLIVLALLVRMKAGQWRRALSDEQDRTTRLTRTEPHNTGATARAVATGERKEHDHEWQDGPGQRTDQRGSGGAHG